MGTNRHRSSWSCPPKLRDLVVQTYGRTCHLCGLPIFGLVSPDHVIPRAKGGSDALENLRPSHLRCNLRRKDRDLPAPIEPATRW